MKIFFDRLTDITDAPYKPIGKQLAGKTLFTVATGGKATAPSCFVEPFSQTAGYFNMNWGGLLYRRGANALSEEVRLAARNFAKEITATEASF